MTLTVLNTRQLESMQRRHVQSLDWADSVGTDFWLFAGSAVNGATTFLLSSRGWTTTSLGLTAGSAADFLSASDKGTPRSILTNAGNDLLQSPVIFGDYTHAKSASMIMGKTDLPRYLIMDVLGAMGTASANETTSGFGLVEDGGTAGTAADGLAWIVSDGTNFKLTSGADSDAGAAIDTSPHAWRVILDSGLGTNTDAVEWFIDGTSQGTIDLETDEFPVSFGIFADTTNRPALSVVHIYYAWDRRYLDPLTV